MSNKIFPLALPGVSNFRFSHFLDKFLFLSTEGRHSEAAHEIQGCSSQKCSRGGVHYEGVGWGGACYEGVGGVGCVMEGWGGMHY